MFHRGVRHGLVVAAALLLSSAGFALADEVKVNGLLSFESEDHQFSAQLGGRLQQDWVFFHADDDAHDELGLRSTDGVAFRRARLLATGKMYGNIAYRAEYDFANGKLNPTDLYIQLKGVPAVGNVRVGHFYEPFSLEELTSDNYVTFVERSLASPLVPARNPGISIFNVFPGKRATWALGLYRDDAGSDITTSLEGGAYSQTARVTALPLRNEESRTLVHLGAAASHRRPPHHARSYSFRPEINQGTTVLTTGQIGVDDMWLLGGEAAFGVGPFCLQGEYVLARHNGLEEEEEPVARHEGEIHHPTVSALYAFGSLFLTGDSRPYDAEGGVFTRVRPKRNFGDGTGGMGAFELTGRVSYVDLDDEENELVAGKMTDVTVGLNWYLNPQTRVTNNFVLADIEDGLGGEGKASSFQTRFAIDF